MAPPKLLTACHGDHHMILKPFTNKTVKKAAGMAKPFNGYDDEELSISLAPSNNRRTQNKPADASSGHPTRPNDQQPQQSTASARKPEVRVGAYQVLRTLGEGSFGKVKLAVHRVTKQEVALKIIARKKLVSRDMAGRVEREIEYLQLLRHPHIIKLYALCLRAQKRAVTDAK